MRTTNSDDKISQTVAVAILQQQQPSWLQQRDTNSQYPVGLLSTLQQQNIALNDLSIKQMLSSSSPSSLSTEDSVIASFRPAVLQQEDLRCTIRASLMEVLDMVSVDDF